MNRIRKIRRNGFSIVVVVMVMILVSAGVVVLSGICNDMFFQTRLSKSEADTRNLTESGLAWAEVNYKKISASQAGKEIVLDVSKLEIPDCGLSVAKSETAENTVKITTRQKYHNKDIEQTRTLSQEYSR